MPVSYGGQSQQRWGDNTVNKNEYIRDIFVPDLKGIMQGTMPMRKKGMLALCFFRTDDPVSQRVLPLLQKMADAYKESGKLSVLAVSMSEPEATAAFLDRYGIKFPVALDRDDWHAMHYGIATVPVVYLTDANGLVLNKAVGFKPLILNDISERYATFAEVEAVPLVEGVPTGHVSALLDGAVPLGALPAPTDERPTPALKPDDAPTMVSRPSGGESPTVVTRKD